MALPPLHAAAEIGHLEVVKHLLAQEGIDVNAARDNGFTPLSVAAYRGYLEVLKRLLAQEGIEVNKADNGGFTPLHAAAERGHIKEVIKCLVEKGADVNQADEKGFTPLHFAAQKGHPNIVRLLFDYGADSTVFIDKEKTNFFRTAYVPSFDAYSDDVKKLLRKYPQNKQYYREIIVLYF